MRRLLTLLCFFSLAPLLVKPLNPSLNDDVLGLIVFKADIQDPKGKLASWDEDDDSPCDWVGVKCNPRSYRVVELNLNGFSLFGHLGRGLLKLQSLRKLSLAKNNLTGSVKPSIARLDNLRELDLSQNSLTGTIPDEFFQQCGSLRSVSFASNRLSGKLPKKLGLCSMLASIDLSWNQFSGALPVSIWSLGALRMLDLSGNSLEGEIPAGIEAMKNLRSVNLKKNRLSGAIPDGIGSCLLLRSIDLSDNSFSSILPRTLQQLTLCSYLDLHGNSFSGEIPHSIGQIKALETLDLSDNAFSGKLPSSFGNLASLQKLNVSGNSLTGPLPESLSSCRNLQVADFSQNSFAGDLPDWIFKGSFRKLQALDLSSNFFSGQIPTDVGYISGLRFLNLSNNFLAGSVPVSTGRFKDMDILDLSDNWLNGSIPSEIGGAISLKELRLQKNELSGHIPTSIGKCSSLTTLIISQNCLDGPIPSSLSKLRNLQTVDLSCNNLSGTLPKQLANLAHLLSFNISHNKLQGQLPLGGFFNTISPSSVSSNPSLCGSVMNRSCPGVLPKPIVLNPNSTGDSTPGSLPPPLGHKRIILSISALIAIGAAAVIVIGVIAITVVNLHVRSTSFSCTAAALKLSAAADELFSGSSGTDASSGKLVMFSSMDPDFSTGAHALLNKDCELGRGGFGAVYRTILQDGNILAIKKLTVSSLVKSQDDFEKEVKKLGKVRHPNLVALEGYYWTPSLQLLISEFVLGKSLYKLLHDASGGDPNSSLSWNYRFNIILGTAKGLAHLHQMNIIHYNIKSSNVLIDSSSGEPKVADFGLARLLPMLDRYVLSSKIQSALGYMAPEFACRTVKITEKCDVYGFGVLVLEIVTGKRPVEYLEDDVMVLCEMVRGALEEGRVEECLDKGLNGNYPTEEAIPVMKLGLICTSQVPSNRPDMAEVVNILELIRWPSEEQEELV